MFELDKQKYLTLLKTKGLSTALTALHHDTREWENETFEGPQGYNAMGVEKLEEVRAFSRQLWDTALEK